MQSELFLFLISLFVSMLLLEPFKSFQRRRHIGQYIRLEGPDLHNHKTGTPTAAGVVFVPVALCVIAIFDRRPETLIVLLSGVLFATIGFIDDYAKIWKKNACGISGKAKLTFQFAASALLVLLIQLQNPHTSMKVPFGGEIEFGFLYYLLSAVVITGMSNAVNLSDGVDGLAGSMFIFSLAPLLLVPFWANPVIASLCGVLAGFLWHNWYPASVFMGDAGSLALGGMLAVIFSIQGREVFLLLFGFMFIVEMFSVIIQVTVYKTFGTRVFKMSPIHHHFELKGWKESKIAFRFSLLALIAAIAGVLSW